MLRSNSYDVLDITISNLKSKLANQNAIIEKSDMKNDLSAYEAIGENYSEMREIASVINSQFQALKSDYTTGKINMAKYRHNLKLLKDLLLHSGEKIIIPELGAAEMVQEIQKHFVN